LAGTVIDDHSFDALCEGEAIFTPSMRTISLPGDIGSRTLLI
jgi:hypothetical protein